MAIIGYGEVIDGQIISFDGLSTDPKPSENVRNRAKFYEIDTGKVWRYNNKNINPITGDYWWEMK